MEAPVLKEGLREIIQEIEELSIREAANEPADDDLDAVYQSRRAETVKQPLSKCVSRNCDRLMC